MKNISFDDWSLIALIGGMGFVLYYVIKNQPKPAFGDVKEAAPTAMGVRG